MIRGQATKKVDPEKAKKSLKSSIIDGSAYSVSEGFGKAYLIPFAIALQASTMLIGLIASLPELIGALFQFLSPKLVEIFKSRKKIIVVCAFLQALNWLPLFFIPLISQKYGPEILLIFIMINAILSYLISPIWNSWMGDLVPEDERGRYFGKRNAITGVAVFIATFAAGYLLNHLAGKHALIGFGILFVIALIARLVSTFYLSKMQDVEYEVDKTAYFSFFDFVKRMSKNNYGRFVLYICLLNFAVYLSAPFFAVYMLKDLHFSYATYMMITLASLISGFIGMYFWGRYNDEHGSRKLLGINGILVAFIPLAWVFTTNIYWLIVIEMFSGVVWAGFNLGAANFIFDATTPQKRTRCIVYYHVLKGIFVFAGAMIGGYLATHIGSWIFISAIPILFIISGVLRLAVSLMFTPLLKEMRLIEVPIGHEHVRTYLTIKHREGIVYDTFATSKSIEPKLLVSPLRFKKPPNSGTGKVQTDLRKKDMQKNQDKQVKATAKEQPKKSESKDKTNKQLLGFLMGEMKKK